MTPVDYFNSLMFGAMIAFFGYIVVLGVHALRKKYSPSYELKLKMKQDARAERWRQKRESNEEKRFNWALANAETKQGRYHLEEVLADVERELNSVSTSIDHHNTMLSFDSTVGEERDEHNRNLALRQVRHEELSSKLSDIQSALGIMSDAK